MSKPNDGGPAFPRTYEFVEDGERMDDTMDGMTLRDYFAGQAVAKAVVPLPKSIWQCVRWAFGLKFEASAITHEHNARQAFLAADAMLAERNAPSPERTHEGELQRIKIAEACGWTAIQQPTRSNPKTIYRSPDHRKYATVWVKGGYGGDPLPDYLNDLNAMHEAEKVLNMVRRVQYSNELRRLIIHRSPVVSCDEYELVHATAAQRAEAFLRTLNLWEDA